MLASRTYSLNMYTPSVLHIPLFITLKSDWHNMHQSKTINGNKYYTSNLIISLQQYVKFKI